MTTQARPLNPDREGCPGSYLLFDFASGSAELRPDHRKYLDEPIAQILGTDTASVRLTGRALDSEPSAAQGLALNRANAVATYLRGKGVASDRVQVSSGPPPALSDSNSAADQRSVEITPSIAKTFRLILRDIGTVGRTNVAVKVIDDALRGIVARAGRELQSVRARKKESGDVTITFSRVGVSVRPCSAVILGMDGGGQVYVDAHEELRVCGSPTRDEDGEMDYRPTIERIFDPTEAAFAQAVANTALHEFGHIVADLQHSPEQGNYLFSTDRGAVLEKAQRSRESMRALYAGPRSYDATQQRAIVCAVRSGYYSGGERIASAR